MNRRFWQGVWRVADPKITLASVASMVLGAGAAASQGPLHWGWLGLTALGIFAVEAAKNASGEVFDWDSGVDQAVTEADRSPFSGGKRVLVDGLMSRRQAFGVALAFYGLGAIAGLAIVALREPSVLWLGLAGFGLAFFYHAPPLRLSYRGLGELAVAVAYGPLVACGTYLVQQRTVDPVILLPSIPLGMLIAAFLWINEHPDRRADESSGKRTLVVRLGPRRAARAFFGIILGAYVLVVLLPLFGLPPMALLGLAGLPHGIRAARQLRAVPDRTSAIIPAQGWTLLSFLLMAAGTAIGLALSG